MDNYPDGIAHDRDVSKYISDYLINNIYEKYGTRTCCACDEDAKEYPFLCGHAVHQKCLETWLKNNPFKLRCFTCKAPIRYDIYKMVKPKSVSPILLTEEEKSMLAQFNYIECPQCKIMIEKNGGCNSMHCINCGNDFKYELLNGLENYNSPLILAEYVEETKFQEINRFINHTFQKYQGIVLIFFILTSIKLLLN